MSFVDTVKALGTVVVEAAKANPVVFIGGAVGTAVLGYAGYRGVKAYRTRGAVAKPAVAVVDAVPGAALALPAEATDVALLSLTRAEAESMGVFDTWAEALIAKLNKK